MRAFILSKTTDRTPPSPTQTPPSHDMSSSFTRDSTMKLHVLRETSTGTQSSCAQANILSMQEQQPLGVPWSSRKKHPTPDRRVSFLPLPIVVFFFPWLSALPLLHKKPFKSHLHSKVLEALSMVQIIACVASCFSSDWNLAVLPLTPPGHNGLADPPQVQDRWSKPSSELSTGWPS